jgi:galactosylxylosylprotein 3-beta-galactosyltransferase
LILLLNIALQLFLSLLFGFLAFPIPGQPGQLTEEVEQCSCPQSKAQMEQKSEQQQKDSEAVTCGVPPSPSHGQAAVPPNSDDHRSIKKSLVDDTHYLLVVLVLSSVGGRERRDAIRETWMEGYSDLEHKVLVRFSIGTLRLSQSDSDALNTEQHTFNDLLLLPNLQESYSNLTLKVLYSFITLDQNYDFSYLMKCDDDTFIVLRTVLKELSERTSQKKSFYWGFFDGRAHVKKQGKWSEKEWFLCDRYLPYALGGGYLLSHDLVSRISSAADGLQLYNSEDVSVGVWLSPYEAERRHDVRFDTEFVSRGCRNEYIVSHKQSVEDMRKKHRTLKTTGRLCEREYQTRMSYEYNWNVEPTKCCERKRGVL